MTDRFCVFGARVGNVRADLIGLCDHRLAQRTKIRLVHRLQKTIRIAVMNEAPPVPTIRAALISLNGSYSRIVVVTSA